MKIVTDTASLFSPMEGKELGITVLPACTVIDGKVYRDFEDISSEEILKLVDGGAVPTTSQPSVGDMLEVLENQQEEVLFISIGDGLSGGYQNAMGVKNSMENGEKIHVIDTKTLAGAEHYLVQKAIQLKERGCQIGQIKEELQKCIETSVSFVIPVDFNFLKRSGRLTPIAAKIGSMIKIVPVLTQTEDMKRIAPFAIKRSRKKAVEAILERLKSLGVDDNYVISICHTGVCESAKEVLQQVKKQFANTATELFTLSPSLVTHGGPGCIVIQAIRK